ncbi:MULTISPECIES: hypothetical protein [unclassified Helicobacter]|nr:MULTISPECIES: hypothetical protein [unclassified Helicobacter]
MPSVVRGDLAQMSFGADECRFCADSCRFSQLKAKPQTKGYK